MFMKKLDVKEVHGYNAELGISVFRRHVLEQRSQDQIDAGEARGDDEVSLGDNSDASTEDVPFIPCPVDTSDEKCNESPVHIGTQHKEVLGLESDEAAS